MNIKPLMDELLEESNNKWYSVMYAYGDAKVEEHPTKKAALDRILSITDSNSKPKKEQPGEYEVDGRHLIIKGKKLLKDQGYLKDLGK